MRFIPTKVHGALDYLSGLLFILSPWIFDFANGGAAQWVPILVGATVLVMSLITDYEFSIAKKVPMPTHLAIDVLGGGLLAASPWLFGFNDVVFWPHLLFGLVEVGAGLLTRQVPDYRAGEVIPEPEAGAYKRGNVVREPGLQGSADHEAQRNMTKDEELNVHVDEKEQERAADSNRSRSTQPAKPSSRRHD